MKKILIIGILAIILVVSYFSIRDYEYLFSAIAMGLLYQLLSDKNKEKK